MLGSCGGVSVALAAIPVLPQHPRCGVEARLHVQLQATPGSAWSEEGWEARQTPLVPPSRRSISYEADCHQYSGGICRPLPPAGWLYLGEACAGAAAVQIRPGRGQVRTRGHSSHDETDTHSGRRDRATAGNRSTGPGDCWATGSLPRVCH